MAAVRFLGSKAEGEAGVPAEDIVPAHSATWHALPTLEECWEPAAGISFLLIGHRALVPGEPWPPRDIPEHSQGPPVIKR